MEGVGIKEDGFSFQEGASLTLTQEALTKLEKAYGKVEALREAYPKLSATLDQTLTYTFYCLGKFASFSAGLGGATLGAPLGPGGIAGGFIGGYTLSEKLQEAVGKGIEVGLDQLSSLAASKAQNPEQAQRFQECVYNTGATALLFLGAKGGRGKVPLKNGPKGFHPDHFLLTSKVFNKTTQWTSPVGTQQTYKVYLRNDIDWNLVRTAGDKNFRGKTNKDAALAGHAPQLKDGHTINLHHVGQNNQGPLAEVSTKHHNPKNQETFRPLHNQFGGKGHPEFPVNPNRQKFDGDRKAYWKWRASNVE